MPEGGAVRFIRSVWRHDHVPSARPREWLVHRMTVHINEQAEWRETPTITNCQGLLNGGRRPHYCTGNEGGIAPLHALDLTPASC